MKKIPQEQHIKCTTIINTLLLSQKGLMKKGKTYGLPGRAGGRGGCESEFSPK